MNISDITIIGANGQLGKELVKKYPEARALDKVQLDIADNRAVVAFDWSKTKILINAAAFTNVDGAETPDGRVSAWKINASAVANLVSIANKYDMTLIQVSTDYVFDGSIVPHKETEPLSPLNVYGQSKAAGDIVASTASKHYIMRTSWVIGDGTNFVKTMLGLANKGISPKVVCDQEGRPTFTSVLASAIDFLLINASPYGIYNVSNEGRPVNWAEFTRSIFSCSGHSDLLVSDITTEAYFLDKANAAQRPMNSTFDLSKIEALGFIPEDWLASLETYVKSEVEK